MIKWVSTKEDEQLSKKNGSGMEENEDEEERGREIIEKCSECLVWTLKHFLNPFVQTDGGATYLSLATKQSSNSKWVYKSNPLL